MGILLVYDVTDEKSFNSKYSPPHHRHFPLLPRCLLVDPIHQQEALHQLLHLATAESLS